MKAICPVDNTTYTFTEEEANHGNYSTYCPKCHRSLSAQELQKEIKEVKSAGGVLGRRVYIEGDTGIWYNQGDEEVSYS